jgi:hypothetical protein
MTKYFAGLAAVIVGFVVAYYALRGDPIAEILNQKWRPISVDQQRQKAIETSADALNAITRANLAAGVDVKTIVALASPLLKPQGVTALRATGDRQLLKIEADFDRTFGADDLPADFNQRDLVVKLKPDIQGTISFSVGITGGAADQQALSLQLKLLPVLNNIRIEKIKLADKVDITAVGDVVVFLLNRYADNVTAKINEAAFLNISLPTTLSSVAGQAGPLSVSVPSVPDVKVSLSTKPIKNPFQLAGVAWLIDGNRLLIISQLAVSADRSKFGATTATTFSTMKDDFILHLKDGLETAELSDDVWVVVSKALLADSVNSTFAQAEPCISAQGPIPTQALSVKVPLPDETSMDCSPKAACDLQVDERDCRRPRNCSHNHDTRDCSRCIASAFNHCIQHGNDPLCEIAKAAQNKIYDADFNACNGLGMLVDAGCEVEKGTQNGIYAAAKAKCESEKVASKGLCETEKEGLKRLSRTGKFANIDVSMGGPANLKACFSAVKMSDDLRLLSLNLSVDGKGDIATHVKFVPLDIVGHLACQVPWTEDRLITATVPNQLLPVKVNLTSKNSNGKQVFDGRIDEITLKLHFEPSPTALLLQSTNFTLACLPLAGLINSVTLNLGPLIPELLKDFDFKQGAIVFSFAPQLPNVNVLNSGVKMVLSETSHAIVLTGTVETP